MPTVHDRHGPVTLADVDYEGPPCPECGGEMAFEEGYKEPGHFGQEAGEWHCRDCRGSFGEGEV